VDMRQAEDPHPRSLSCGSRRKVRRVPLRGIASLPAWRNVGYGRQTMPQRALPPQAPAPPAGPERMRQAMADFVAAVHAAYLAQARLLGPAAPARLPPPPGP